jgi:hypothetical protein
MTEEDKALVKALRALPYAEYLKTGHWQRRRWEALGRSGYRCQVCNSYDRPLEVHHRTYERLGCEHPSDLFVLCDTCHDLFSTHGKLAKPRMEALQPRGSVAPPDEDIEDEDTDDDDPLSPAFPPDWDEDETALIEAEVSPSWLTHVMHHPHLTLGGGSLLLSFVIDVAVRFDSFAVIVGLGTAAVIGWKGEDLMIGTMKLLVPGSDQEQAQEDADRFAEDFLGDYPIHPDQRPLSKLKRLFKIDEIVEALPDPSLSKKRAVKKLNGPPNASGGEGLTYARIAEWFEEGRIDDTQFFALLDRIEHPRLSRISESGESVKRPGRLREGGESAVKVYGEGESISPEDEQAVIRTAFALQQMNGKVTREDIKATLQWNNKKHWIVKAVCDKYGIAMQGGK